MTITTKHAVTLKLNTKKSQSALTFSTPARSADVVLCPANPATAYFNPGESFNILKSDLTISSSTEEVFCPPSGSTTVNDQTLIIDELKKSKTNKITQPIYQNPAAELKKISDEILAVKISESNKINVLSNRLGELRKQIPKNSIEDIELGNVLHKNFLEILKKNQAYQEEKIRLITSGIKDISSHILQNNFKKAQSKWSQIQSAKKGLSSGSLKKIIKTETETKRSFYNFRDSTLKENARKKEELIEKMLSLACSVTHEAERMNQLKEIHCQWKDIGVAKDESKLWNRFKKASDQTYKSCKEYFRRRDELKISNEKERNNLCDILEKKLAALKTQEADIKEITFLLKEIDITWKTHSPVNDNKAKDLNKRYYQLTSAIWKTRKFEFKNNEICKKKLITEAKSLNSTNPEAKKQIKELQAKWKSTKTAGAKKDNDLWKEFREICDTFFNQNPKKSKNQHTNANGEKVNSLLSSFKALADAPFLELENCQAKVGELKLQLKALLDGYRDDKKSLITRQFRGYQHQIDLKMSALPNPKQKDELNSVISANEQFEKLEKQLLETSSSETYSAAFNRLKSQEIPPLQLPKHPQAQEALQSRAQNIKVMSSHESFSNEIMKSERKMRLLCVELELLMGLKTPEEDQKIRTEMNLQQLKQMFGKGKPTKSEIIKIFHKNYLTVRSLGPIPSKIKTELQSRYEEALVKYLSSSSS